MGEKGGGGGEEGDPNFYAFLCKCYFVEPSTIHMIPQFIWPALADIVGYIEASKMNFPTIYSYMRSSCRLSVHLKTHKHPKPQGSDAETFR